MATTGQNSGIIGQLVEFDPKTSDWAIYKKRLEQYFLANAIVDDKRKRAILLNLLNQSAYTLLMDLLLPSEPETTEYKDLLKQLDKYYQVSTSIFAERTHFYSLTKDIQETVREWSVRVKNGAKNCKFNATMLNEALRDKFVIGFDPGTIKNQLYQKDASSLTFNDAVDEAVRLEAASADRGESGASAPVRVKSEPAEVLRVGKSRAVHYQSSGAARGRSWSAARGQRSPGTSVTSHRSDVAAQNDKFTSARKYNGASNLCNVCGKANHAAINCRFKNYVCNRCHVRGHLKKVCPKRNVYSLDVNNDDVNNEIDIFEFSFEGSKPLLIDVLVNDYPMTMQIDTGAGVSAISKQIYENKFSELELVPTNNCLITYTGNRVTPLGTINVNISHKSKNIFMSLYVVENGGSPLLGRDWLEKMNYGIADLNVIGVEHDCISSLIKKFPKLFSGGLGTFNKEKATLSVKEGHVPKYFKPRALPVSLKEKVDKELDRLLEHNIIKPVDYSNWGTPIVPILKEDGTVRICGDFKITVNPWLNIDRHPIPRIDELFNVLQGGQEFTKIDLQNAYLQLLLDENSRELTTISTHRGLFQYLRLCFGLASAPSIFQKNMEKLLQGIEGVTIYLDDILVTGKNRKQHMERLCEVLRRLEEAGLKIKREKCCFLQKSVKYLGHIIDKTGLHMDDSKIIAIQNAPSPTDITTLKSFLGMVTYYQKFIPNMANTL